MVKVDLCLKPKKPNAHSPAATHQTTTSTQIQKLNRPLTQTTTDTTTLQPQSDQLWQQLNNHASHDRFQLGSQAPSHRIHAPKKSQPLRACGTCSACSARAMRNHRVPPPVPTCLPTHQYSKRVCVKLPRLEGWLQTPLDPVATYLCKTFKNPNKQEPCSRRVSPQRQKIAATLHARTFAKLTDLQPTSERTPNMFRLWHGVERIVRNRTTFTDRPEPRTVERDTLPVRHRPIARASERASRNLSQASSARPNSDSNQSSRLYQARTAPSKTGWAGWEKKIFRRSGAIALPQNGHGDRISKSN